MLKALARGLRGFVTAVGMYSVFPVPQLEWEEENTGLLIPCLPLVGGLIGLVWWGAAVGLRAFGAPALLAAVLLALVPFALSGFLHADGLMDTADALFSRRPREEKLRILKDSHTGAFGVVALAVVLLLSVGAADGVLTQGKAVSLLVLPILSRCICGLLLLKMPLLFPEGYAAFYRAHSGRAQLVWLVALTVVCLGLGAVTGGFPVVAALLACAAGQGLAAWRCKVQLGGISGDVSGFVLCIGELCGVLCAALI